MDENIRDKVLNRIQHDYGLKIKGRWLRGGTCPTCGKKELYANAEDPFVLVCGREKNCGERFYVKDIYDDIFGDWSKLAPVSNNDPKASANAYLRYARGFDIDLFRDAYVQENYFSRDLNLGSATVRFPLPSGSYWERLIDRPERFGKTKARFSYGVRVTDVWVMPDVDVSSASEIWMTEGIFDAIALAHYGKATATAMSCNNYPEEWLTNLAKARVGNMPTLVWALDGDSAGQSYTRKHVRRARALGFRCRAAQIKQGDKKVDWNDLHLRWKNIEDDEAKARAIHVGFEMALYHGDLLLAERAEDKAILMYNHLEVSEFWFGHESRLYWFKLDLDKLNAAHIAIDNKYADKDIQKSTDEIRDEALRAAGAVVEIANCYPEALYYQRNEITDESWYFFRVDFPHAGGSVKGTFTGGQVVAASEFKKRLAHIAPGAIFTGTGSQLDRIMKAQLFSIKTVETIDFVGYSREHGAYVFGDLAIKDGQLYQVNDEDFFEFGKLRLKTLQKSIRIKINRDMNEYRSEWLEWLLECFGHKGIITLAFWFGSLFAEQIREKHESFPFLEATGEPGAGKTTLLKLMWKLLGRAGYEGFDPSKSSSAGRSRAMGQVAGMPIALIEGDRSDVDKPHHKSFDWDELKDFFGGGTLRTRGMKTGGNETYEPPFRATIAISQNAAVNASEAILSRIVKLHFTVPTATNESRAAADNINHISGAEVSGFVLKACRHERAILDLFDTAVKRHVNTLRMIPEIRMERIAKCHAQMMALVDCLQLVCGLTDQWAALAQAELIDMAKCRQRAINTDHPMVSEFWSAVDYLEDMGNDRCRVNHSSKDGEIAINLNEFAEIAKEHRQDVPDLNKLRQLLRDSRSRPLTKINHPISSSFRTGKDNKPKVLKCWVFKA